MLSAGLFVVLLLPALLALPMGVAAWWYAATGSARGANETHRALERTRTVLGTLEGSPDRPGREP